jgi:hypothetical protein
VIDVIVAPEHAIRNLQKPLWLLIVLLLPLVGSILWLVAGRPQPHGSAGRGTQGRQPQTSSGYPEYDHPGRFTASNPDDGEAFLRQVRARAEEQRRRYREQQAEERRREDEADRQRRRKSAADDEA